MKRIKPYEYYDVKVRVRVNPNLEDSPIEWDWPGILNGPVEVLSCHGPIASAWIVAEPESVPDNAEPRRPVNMDGRTVSAPDAHDAALALGVGLATAAGKP